MPKARDYAREGETEKARGETRISIKLSKQLADEFAAKCVLNNTTRNAVLKSYIERYVYQNFDQPSE